MQPWKWVSPEQLLRPDYPVHRMPVMSTWQDPEQLLRPDYPVHIMPVMSNWPGPEQLLRPDYPVHRMPVMSTWPGRRTESRGSCKSSVSFKSDRSRELGLDFKERSPFSPDQQRPNYPVRSVLENKWPTHSFRLYDIPEQLLRPDYPVHRMPVMSTWPGPNYIFPSVEEHAATDGEDMVESENAATDDEDMVESENAATDDEDSVESENTSTEDVVLVQPLDNLPEQLLRPDYPVLSGIMESTLPGMGTERPMFSDSGLSLEIDCLKEVLDQVFRH